MTKRDPKQLLENISELKSDMKIPQKLFKDAYRDESKRLKKIEKLMMKAINSKQPVTEGDLCTGFALMYKELQDIVLQIHIEHLSYVKNIERIGEINIALNAIFSILKDITSEIKNKSTKKKVRKIEKDLKEALNFKDEIINKINQKQEDLQKSKNTRLSYID